MIDFKCRYNLEDTPLKFSFKSVSFSFMIDDLSSSVKVGDPGILVDLSNKTQIKLSKIGNCYYRMTDHLKVFDKKSIIDEMKLNIDFMSRVFDILNILVYNLNPNSIDLSDVTGDSIFEFDNDSELDIIVLWSMVETIPKDKLIITIF